MKAWPESTPVTSDLEESQVLVFSQSNIYILPETLTPQVPPVTATSLPYCDLPRFRGFTRGNPATQATDVSHRNRMKRVGQEGAKEEFEAIHEKPGPPPA